MKVNLEDRMHRWYSWTGGRINRFLLHPDDKEAALKLTKNKLVYLGKPIHFLPEDPSRA